MYLTRSLNLGLAGTFGEQVCAYIIVVVTVLVLIWLAVFIKKGGRK